MKISSVILKLESKKTIYGDIEFTCTGSAGNHYIIEAPVESVLFFSDGPLGDRVKLFS